MKFYKFFLLKSNERIFDIIDLLNKNINNFKEKDFVFKDKNYTFEYKQNKDNYFFEIKSGENTPNVCRDIEKKEYTTLEDNLYYIDEDQIFIFVFFNKQYNYVYISNEDKGSLFIKLLELFNIKGIKIEHQTKEKTECLELFKKNVRKLKKIVIKGCDYLYLQELFTLTSGVIWDKMDIKDIQISINLESNNLDKINTNINIIKHKIETNCGTLFLEGEDEEENIIKINKNGFYESIFINTKDVALDENNFFNMEEIYNKILNEIEKRYVKN